jgi:hypothetical protein
MRGIRLSPDFDDWMKSINSATLKTLDPMNGYSATDRARPARIGFSSM